MAKEDFCFTYYDGDATRDMAHMNRLERGGYSDIIISQRKFGHLTIDQIKKILGKDFDEIFGAIELILMTDQDGKFFIEWVEDSINKSRKNAAKNKKRVDDYWKSVTDKEYFEKFGRLPDRDNGNTEIVNGIDLVIPNSILVEPLGNENGILNKENCIDEMPIGFQMQQLFVRIVQGYVQKPSQDMPAISEIAMLIHRQQGGTKREMFEMDIGEKKIILDQWRKWIEWYQIHGNNKPLEYLVKFKIQEIAMDIKNGKKNGNNVDTPAPTKIKLK